MLPFSALLSYLLIILLWVWDKLVCFYLSVAGSNMFLNKQLQFPSLKFCSRLFLYSTILSFSFTFPVATPTRFFSEVPPSVPRLIYFQENKRDQIFTSCQYIPPLLAKWRRFVAGPLSVSQRPDTFPPSYCGKLLVCCFVFDVWLHITLQSAIPFGVNCCMVFHMNEALHK